MKWLVYILVIAIVVVIQQSIFNVLNLKVYTPDLFLLLTLALVWTTNNYDYIIFAMMGGFWSEVTYGLPIGTIMLGLMIAGSVAYLVINRWLFTEKSWQHFFGVVAASTIFLHFWFWFYTSLLFIFNWSEVVVVGRVFLGSLLPALLVNLLLTYPIFMGMELLTGWVQKLLRPQVMKI